MSKVIIEKNGPVKTVWMNRPEKKNALDSELLGNMIEALQAPVAADDRVIVIRGKGDVFCAGLDMAERRETIKDRWIASRVGWTPYDGMAVTGWPVRKDLPRSPIAAWRMNVAYCVRSGWSRPSAFRSSSTSLGAAPSPSMACAGSPGTIRTMTKTSVSTANSVITANNRRRIKKAVIKPIQKQRVRPIQRQGRTHQANALFTMTAGAVLQIQLSSRTTLRPSRQHTRAQHAHTSPTGQPPKHSQKAIKHPAPPVE